MMQSYKSQCVFIETSCENSILHLVAKINILLFVFIPDKISVSQCFDDVTPTSDQ